MSYIELFGPLMNEVKPGLFLGTMMASKNKTLLRRHNITHVLIVAANLTQHFPEDMTYLQVPLADDEGSDLLSQFPRCIEFISGAIASGGNVLVHCAAGVSRSAAVVIAYLLAKENLLSVHHAREFVKQRRPVICPNDGFMKQLYLFESMGKRIDPLHSEYKWYLRSLMNSGDS